MALPRLSLAEVQSERIARRVLRESLDFSRLEGVLREVFAVELEDCGARQSYAPAESLGANATLTVRTLSAWVSVQPALASLLLSRLMTKQVTLEQPNPLEGALLGAWHAIVDQVATRLAVGEPPGMPTASPRAPSGPGWCIQFWLRLDGVTYRGQSLLQASSASSVTPNVCTSEHFRTSSVPLELRLVLASTVCERETLRSLQLGDVFIPQPWSVNERLEGEAVLCAPGAERGIRVALSRPSLELRNDTPWTLCIEGPAELPHEPSEPAPAERTKEPMMSTETDTLHDAVADAPVLVRVEVGSVTMSAREWVTLSPGDVIGMGSPLNQPVVLRVAGHQVAEGELVNIDGELGVRVTKLA
ncbi:MAG: hypothetical protein RJA70_1024 [Pseudomonadota bacterium]|jgi:type III secretion system YscQ/HrcQ family protein